MVKYNLTISIKPRLAYFLIRVFLFVIHHKVFIRLLCLRFLCNIWCCY